MNLSQKKMLAEYLLSISLSSVMQNDFLHYRSVFSSCCYLANLYSSSDFSVSQYYRLEELLWAFVSLQMHSDESLQFFLPCVTSKICMCNKSTNHCSLFVTHIKCIPKGWGEKSKLRWFKREHFPGNIPERLFHYSIKMIDSFIEIYDLKPFLSLQHSY